VSKITNVRTLQGREEGMFEEISLQAFPKKQSVTLLQQCSTVGRRRLEKNWLPMIERRVYRTSDNEERSRDANGPRCQTTGGIPPRGSADPFSVDICTPGQPATLAPSHSAAVWGLAVWQWQPKVIQIRVHDHYTNQALDLILTLT